MNLRNRNYLFEKIDNEPREILKSVSFYGKRMGISADKLQLAINSIFSNKELEFLDRDIDLLSLKENLIPVLKDTSKNMINKVKRHEEDFKYSLEQGYISNTDLKVVKDFKNIIEDILKRNNIMVDIIKRGKNKKTPLMYDTEDDLVPDHEKIETLYHASVNAKQIKERGFSIRRPNSFIGLGGSTGTMMGEPAISFTYDLRVAKEIARVFKELTMVAKGKVKIYQIFDWAKRAGISKDKMIKVYRDQGGTADYTGEYDAVGMYQSYLSLAGFAKKRYNPWFSNQPSVLQKRFSKIKYGDIGVVVADVDISNLEKQSHMAGERELRVYPKDIIKVKKVI